MFTWINITKVDIKLAGKKINLGNQRFNPCFD